MNHKERDCLKKALLEIESLKKKLLALEIKHYGCSEEEHIRKNLINEASTFIINKLFDREWQDKNILLNEASHITNIDFEIVKDAYNSLLNEKRIKESSGRLPNVEIVCVTLTGRRDCHNIYGVVKIDKSGNKNWVCAFCGKK